MPKTLCYVTLSTVWETTNVAGGALVTRVDRETGDVRPGWNGRKVPEVMVVTDRESGKRALRFRTREGQVTSGHIERTFVAR